EMQLEPNLPPVLLDENAMTLALLNLLENAVKYAAPGSVKVSVRRMGGMLELAVADRGPGIPEGEQSHIFDRFYLAKNARNPNASGSGIGLSLVKHIAEAHGGQVVVDSQPGRGATFTITVPIPPSPEMEEEPARALGTSSS